MEDGFDCSDCIYGMIDQRIGDIDSVGAVLCDNCMVRLTNDFKRAMAEENKLEVRRIVDSVEDVYTTLQVFLCDGQERNRELRSE